MTHVGDMFERRPTGTRATIVSGEVVYEGAVSDLDTAKVAKLLGVGRLLGAHLERAVGKPARPARKRAARTR